MKITEIRFTDAHGVAHTAAQFQLQHANRHTGQSEIIGDSVSSSQMVSVNYVFRYWYSQEAKNTGMQPSVLVTLNGSSSFDVYPTIDESTEDLETFCINHLLTVTLPAIDPAATVITS